MFSDKEEEAEATDKDIEGAYMARVIINKWKVKGWAVDWDPLWNKEVLGQLQTDGL
jgi:hypothetical protein